MSWIKTLLPLVVVWLISLPLYAAQTLTYGPESKIITGVKITMTESDGTVTILTTDSNGQVTLPTTSNTYTLAASLAETGDDPVDLLDAIWILQHSGELRTLTGDQQKAADVSDDAQGIVYKPNTSSVFYDTSNDSDYFFSAHARKTSSGEGNIIVSALGLDGAGTGIGSVQYIGEMPITNTSYSNITNNAALAFMVIEDSQPIINNCNITIICTISWR